MSKSPGRPKGSKSRQAVQTAAYPPRCPKCGSTEREPFSGVIRESEIHTDPMGQPCTHIVWRRTQCRACGQLVIVRAYENRAATEAAAAE